MVADRVHRGHAVLGLALIGLTIVVHYAWAWFPPEQQARVWNACGALGRLVLLTALVLVAVLVWRVRSLLVLLCAAWWACEELMTIGCSVAFLYAKWLIPEGEAQCSALLQMDLGRIGLCAAALLLLRAVRAYRVARNEGAG